MRVLRSKLGPEGFAFRRVRLALYACLPLGVFLLVLEGAARLFWPDPAAEPTFERPYIQYDPQLGWRHIPNASIPNLKSSFEITINAQGCRDTRDYPKAKASAGAYRVIALGDSFTFGHGVATGQSWPAAARRAAPQLDVLNFGVQAYGLDQMALLYEHYASGFEADHVVIALVPDDLRRVYLDRWPSGGFRPQFELDRKGALRLVREVVPRPVGVGDRIVSPEVDGWLFLHSRLARLARERWRAWQSRRDRGALPAAILRRLFADVRAHGPQPITMVLLPDRWAFQPNPERDLAREVLRTECDKAQAEFLDLGPAFEQAAGGGEKVLAAYFGPGGHYSAAGYALAAKLIAQDLLQHAERLKDTKI